MTQFNSIAPQIKVLESEAEDQKCLEVILEKLFIGRHWQIILAFLYDLLFLLLEVDIDILILTDTKFCYLLFESFKGYTCTSLCHGKWFLAALSFATFSFTQAELKILCNEDSLSQSSATWWDGPVLLSILNKPGVKTGIAFHHWTEHLLSTGLLLNWLVNNC